MKKNTPLKLLNIYYIYSIVYYCLGRYEWNIPSYVLLILYLSVCFLSLNLGYKSVNCPIAVELDNNGGLSDSFQDEFAGKIALLFRLSCILICVFQIAWVVVFLGQIVIIDIFKSLGENYYTRLGATFESSVPIMQIRTLFWFVTLFAYPIGFHYWRKMKKIDKALFISAILVDVLAALNMGVSKNLGDIVIIFIATMFLDNRFQNIKIKRKTTIRIIMVMLAFLVIFYIIQALRDVETTGAAQYNPYGSFAKVRETTIFDYLLLRNSALSSIIDRFSLYFTHAYTGLAYSFELPFRNTWGTGFSRALMEYVEQYLGINLSGLTYNARLATTYGWKDGQWWPTAFVWVGNAVSIWLVPVIVFLLGRAYHNFENSCHTEKSILGRVLYCQFTIAFVYLPCNAQIVQGRGAFIATVVLIILYIFRNKIRITWRGRLKKR